jgi:hypothetical protein
MPARTRRARSSGTRPSRMPLQGSSCAVPVAVPLPLHISPMEGSGATARDGRAPRGLLLPTPRFLPCLRRPSPSRKRSHAGRVTAPAHAADTLLQSGFPFGAHASKQAKWPSEPDGGASGPQCPAPCAHRPACRRKASEASRRNTTAALRAAAKLAGARGTRSDTSKRRTLQLSALPPSVVPCAVRRAARLRRLLGCEQASASRLCWPCGCAADTRGKRRRKRGASPPTASDPLFWASISAATSGSTPSGASREADLIRPPAAASSCLPRLPVVSAATSAREPPTLRAEPITRMAASLALGTALASCASSDATGHAHLSLMPSSSLRSSRCTAIGIDEGRVWECAHDARQSALLTLLLGAWKPSCGTRRLA